MTKSQGIGPFVQVYGDRVSLDDMATAITDTITYTRAFADEMRTTLSQSISHLEDVVGAYNPSIPDIDNTVPTIPRPTFPTRPIFGPLNLDENWPDGVIPEPNFVDYGVMDFEYVTPQAPVDIEENFSWTARNYTSDMWQSLFTKVHGAILNGQYGLSEEAHAAIVAREQEARRRNQDKEYRAAVNAAGAMGWNLGGGHTAAFLSEFHGEVLKRDQDALNNITGKDFDIANANMQFFFTQAGDLEKITRDTFDKAETRSLEASKATSEYIARFKSENIKIWLGKWQAIGFKLQALQTKVNAIAQRNDGETKVFVGRAQVLESKVKAITEKNRGKVETRKGEVDVYTAEVGAVRDEYMTLVEEVKINQEAVKTEIDKELRLAGLKLDAFKNKADIGVAVATGISNIGSQGVASALGAINTTLSNSYSGGEKRDESWSFSAGITETHKYEKEE